MKKTKKQRIIKYYSAEEVIKFKKILDGKIGKLEEKKALLSARVEKEFSDINELNRKHELVVKKKYQVKNIKKILNYFDKKVIETTTKRKQKRVVKLSSKVIKIDMKIRRYQLTIEKLELGEQEKLSLLRKFKQGFSRIDYQKQNMIWGIIFILPWIFGMVVLFLPSLLKTFIWSFSEATLTPSGMQLEYVGIGKYVYLFSDYIIDGNNIFSVALLNFMEGLLIDLPVIIIFSILIAVMLNKPFKGHKLIKAIFFIPVVYNLAVITQTLTGTFGQHFTEAMQEDLSFVNQITRFFMDIGIGDSLLEIVLGAVRRIFTIVNLSGIQILIFVAAIQSIPSQLYEVAEIEGATKYEIFWKITIPMIMPMVLTAGVYTVIDSFNRSPILRFLQHAVAKSDYGLGAAISISYFVINLAFVGLIFLLFKGRVFYYDKEK